MPFGQIQCKPQATHPLKSMNRETAPTCTESISLGQQVEITQRDPRIRLTTRGILRRGRDNHIGGIAEDYIVPRITSSM